jgi:hypothetical protein
VAVEIAAVGCPESGDDLRRATVAPVHSLLTVIEKDGSVGLHCKVGSASALGFASYSISLIRSAIPSG